MMEKIIYYYDTDSGGVVYYANYLKYLEEARTEFLRGKGLSVQSLQDKGFLYAVRKCNVTYKAPARYGDVITCDARLKKITAAQLLFEQTVKLKETGSILVEAEVTLVSLDRNFRAVAIPDDIRASLE